MPPKAGHEKMSPHFTIYFLSLSAAQAVDRPPQFIAMVFDNCAELERWQELTDLVSDMNRDGDRIHFTCLLRARTSSRILQTYLSYSKRIIPATGRRCTSAIISSTIRAALTNRP